MEDRLSAIEVKLDRVDSRVAHIERAQSEERGSRKVWRVLGSAAAAIAISIGGYAATVAQTASSDHTRLDALQSEVAEAGAERDEIKRHSEGMSRTLVRIEEMVRGISEKVDETREDVRSLQRGRR